MEQHPIPRQITTFEFKLIGFLTIKQFIYILIFFFIGMVGYFLTPIPYLNYFVGFIIGSIGLAFAFVPINDRPMDIWVKNLIKRLTSPTQYTFKKQNPPIKFLLDSNIGSSPQQLNYYIDSQEKLKSYLAQKNPPSTINPQTSQKQTINDLLISPLSFLMPKAKTAVSFKQQSPVQPQKEKPLPKKPFIFGVVKNYKEIPLGGILIYIKKNENDPPLRILKTNHHGVFLSFNPINEGDYLLQAKDPKGSYLFDTIKLRIEKENNQPIEIRSKELL